MNTNVAITEGVEVRVITQFRGDVSQSKEGKYYFNYRVDIQNKNGFPIQIIHRDWFIFDSLCPTIHVSGEGVVGEQPVIESGEIYNYTSGCEISSEVGAMHGFYTCLNTLSNTYFRVEIPSFELVFPGRMN